MNAYVKILRPNQWTKNILLFAGLVFSKNFLILDYSLTSLFGFTIFCMLSSGGYIINDLLDLDFDRKHPKKSARPLAKGEIKPVSALIYALVLISAGLAAAFFKSNSFGLISLFYVILSLSYSIKLKHIVILDVLIISTGFVIRAIAGTIIINVEISNWLLVCTIFLSLFLALCKRLNELHRSVNGEGITRKNLKDYSPDLLFQLIGISASCALIGYTLYTVDSLTIEKFGTRNLIFTIPFVIYGIFRYLYLIRKTDLVESPELVLLKDRHTLINIFLYFITIIIIIY
ncbi:decaprenyl-phosphate phosphoribosyltransferase [candidate division KSB1 bacterium]